MGYWLERSKERLFKMLIAFLFAISIGLFLVFPTQPLLFVPPGVLGLIILFTRTMLNPIVVVQLHDGTYAACRRNKPVEVAFGDTKAEAIKNLKELNNER